MQLIGWGSVLPATVVDNTHFEKTLDTTDSWIRERTGIVRRNHGGSTSGLASAAGTMALSSAGCVPDDVDLLILATTTPDRQIPATSSTLQHLLELRCGAFDINAACGGFVYALITAYGMSRIGFERILVVGSETLTRFTDMDDRTTAPLMGDGAGAVLVQAVGDDCMLGYDLGCDGSAYDLMYAEIGSTMRMEGREVYKRAVRGSIRSAQRALEGAGLTAGDVDLFIPHQANLRIIEAVAGRMGISEDRTVTTVAWTGNTSAASIPIALDHAASSGRLKPNDVVLLTGFGAGMTTASAVVRWNAPGGGGPDRHRSQERGAGGRRASAGGSSSRESIVSCANAATGQRSCTIPQGPRGRNIPAMPAAIAGRTSLSRRSPT